MAKKSLLTEAIADAKNIKKVALATAKEQLEETFGPKLKSMLAAKLAEDMEEDEDDVNVDDVDETTEVFKKKDAVEDEDDDSEEEVEEVTDVTDEAKTDDDSEEESTDDEEVDEEIDLDELLASLDEKKKVKKAPVDDEEDTEEGDPVNDDEEELDETSGKFNLGSFLDELRNEYSSAKNEAKRVNETKKKAKTNVNFSKQKPSSSGSGIGENQLNELRKQMNDINLINAKLLYLNKTLTENTLSDKQKVSVIKAFDKAGNSKEAKFIYESFTSAFKVNKFNKAKSIKENLGLGSKSAGTSTKKIIKEEVVDAQKERFQILAGLKKRN